MIKKSFQHGNQQYDILERRVGSDIRIRAYRGNVPANNIEYAVSDENRTDLIISAGIDMVEDFVTMAERDVINPPRPI